MCQFNHYDRARIALSGGLDLSSQKTKGDALTFLGRDQDGIVCPVRTIRGQFGISTLVEIVEGVWHSGLHFGVLYVENNGLQNKIIDEIRVQSGGKMYPWTSRILPFKTDADKKFSEEIGMPVLDVEFETGVFVWPENESLRRDSPHARDWALLEAEMMACPRFPKRGETPDGPMSLWFARRAMDRCYMFSRHYTSTAVNSDSETDYVSSSMGPDFDGDY